MSTILRDDGPIYHVRYDKVPLPWSRPASGRSPAVDHENGFDVTDSRPLRDAAGGDDMVSLPLIAATTTGADETDLRGAKTREVPAASDRKKAK